MQCSFLKTEKAGLAGIVTLDRPEALNALSHDMVLALDQALETWREDPAVRLILIRGAGPRAFCAGGDVAEICRAGRAGDTSAGQAFWRDEYRMNARIAAYPKPVVALMQGFIMGGGVGIGCNASHRIVGESSRIAMPETLIGLVPDVGGSRLLAHAPGRFGEYLGLTGHHMSGADALYMGFADHFVAESDWDSLAEVLIASGDPEHIATATTPRPEAPLAAERSLVNEIFDLPDLPAIISALKACPGDFARETLTVLSQRSPLSLAATLMLIRRVRGRDIGFALEQEFRFTARAVSQTDFLEGVRAQLIDKDRAPRWRHDGAEAVTEEEISALLAELPRDIAPLDLNGPAEDSRLQLSASASQ